MESKDIIKALECISGQSSPDFDCDDCRIEKSKYTTCEVFVAEHALDLINQQQAEIEKLKKANGLFEYLNMAVYRQTDIPFEFKTIEAKNDAIRKMIDKLCNIQTAKTEAYKEFADRLKEKASKGFWDELAYVDTEKIDDVYEELTERKED